MNELLNTKKLLAENIENKIFDSYALVVGYKGKEWIYTSDNVNPDTYFDAASVGKVLPTSTLVLKAISDGLLSLDDTLEKYFDNVPDDKKNVTVKHLLTHTSGILRSVFPDNIADRGRESIVEFVLNQPSAFKPEEYYAYSCDAILLLGFIVEKIYGMSLDEVAQKYLCEPLGMTRSRYNIDINEENAATCYHHNFTPEHPWDDDNVTRMNGIPAGNGGNFITARDTQKFVRALLNKDERLYSKELFELAEKNYTDNIEPWPNYPVYGNHGLGYEYVDSKLPQANVLFPEGSAGKEGYTGQSFYFSREKDLYVILLTNATRFTMLKYGEVNYSDVCIMRQKIHESIGKDLNELVKGRNK